MPMSSACVGKRGKRFAHRASARWLMSYAAGLGVSAARYYDTTAELVVHPLFPVCLEWPVILDLPTIEHAATTDPAERARGVHALHDLHIHRPICAGEMLYTTLTVVGLEQRSPGAFQSFRLDTVDESGAPVATTWQGSMLRGVAVSGGDRVLHAWPALPDLDAGVAPDAAGAPLQRRVDIPAHAAHTYTECARIFNPIHTDRAVAQSAGLPDIILHGTATLAHAVSAIVDACCEGEPGRVNRIAGRFSGMVRLPDELRVLGRPVSGEGCAFEVRNASGAVVVRDGFVGYSS